MNQRRFIGIVAVAALVLVVLAWRAAQAKHTAETERRTLAGQRTELMARLQRSETELAAVQKRSAEAPLAGAAQPPAASVAVPVASGTEPRAANSLLEWLQDPKVQVLYFAQERASLAPSYGPFFHAERLTPAQIDRLSDLIIQSRANTHDLSEIRRLQGRSFNDPEMMAQRDRSKAEVEAGMREVLGEAGVARLNDYRRSLEVRTQISRIAGAAAVEGVPISREQADALVGVLASATPSYSHGGNAEFGKIDWQTAEAKAREILSPEQMTLLRGDGPGLGRSRRSHAAFDAIQRAAREVAAKGLSADK